MISAVVLTKNSQDTIKDCLSSLAFVAEIIVIDDFSSDKTVSIAKKFGAKVYQRKLAGDFAKQRNFGLTKTSNSWILCVDADEKVDNLLREEISKIQSSNTDINGYYLKRQDIILGKGLRFGETSRTFLLRFAKKGSGKWKRRVHEYWDVSGKVSRLKYPLNHVSHFDLSYSFFKINYYSQLHAAEKYENKEKSSLAKIMFWPIGKFFVNYIFRFGFLDGVHGFVFAIMMSFHSFLGWSNLWILQKS